MVVHACGSPVAPEPIFKKSGTKTSILLGWQPPSDDGGCPITGYSLLHDGGINGASVSTPADVTLNTNP